MSITFVSKNKFSFVGFKYEENIGPKNKLRGHILFDCSFHSTSGLKDHSHFEGLHSALFHKTFSVELYKVYPLKGLFTMLHLSPFSISIRFTLNGLSTIHLFG